MTEYLVTLPIAGSITVAIEANSKEEALKKVQQQSFSQKEAFEFQWDVFEHICEGNVCHAPLNNIVIEEN